MSFLINPFAFAVAGGDFESIATVTVGSGGAAEIEFTSIPATYQHLQIRALLRGSGSSGEVNCNSRFNGDSGNNYARHQLYGDGSAAGANAASSSNIMVITGMPDAAKSANIFGAFVLDILDYANTAKNKTTRALAGFDANGSGNAVLRSNLWVDTSAITSLTLTAASGTWVQHSTAALFGVKAP